MWIGIIMLGYALSLFLLVRFLQAVHHWDSEIEEMENQEGYTSTKSVVHYRRAS